MNSEMPRQPNPEGPTTMTRNQLAHEQIEFERAHADLDVSRMLKRVVSNMRLLAKFFREAGFAPYLGHAHYIYACAFEEPNQLKPPSFELSSGICTVTSSGFG